jgi:Zn finger protein HypA/HybF involved in hydrogenase expression
MNDEQILERGGDEEDIRKYAEQNGADLTEQDVKIHEEKKLHEPKETLCLDCGQLRLNYIGATECGNCGSKNIKVGKIGELEK